MKSICGSCGGLGTVFIKRSSYFLKRSDLAPKVMSFCAHCSKTYLSSYLSVICDYELTTYEEFVVYKVMSS
jgi:hypothetical protein